MVVATAQKLEKPPSQENSGISIGGWGFLNNVQSFMAPKNADTEGALRSSDRVDLERLDNLVGQVQACASRAGGAATDAKNAEMKVTSMTDQMEQIKQLLAERAALATAAGVGRSLEVPLVVLPPFMKPAPPPTPEPVPQQEEVQRAEPGFVPDSRPYGTGREVLLQGFNWDSYKHNWYQKLHDEADWLASLGFTLIWMPPPTDSVSREGYMPRDLYNLNSAYGSLDALKRCLQRLKEAGLRPLADAVLNHRCASHQNKDGTWNLFGGKLAWDEKAICSDDPNFRGKGNRKSGDVYGAAPNVDHSQEFVKRDVTEWLRWLVEEVGYDGFRFDYVRGYSGKHTRAYMEQVVPHFCVGEYWDSLAYDGGGLEYNQNAHRQRTINWINSAGGLSTAFDMTTKGILHAVFERSEYWRLKDDKGKPPGVLGWWPSRTVTFLENHDTGSTQGHWRFPHHGLAQGYCYILTHPGTPTVFYDHLHDRSLQPVIRDLVALRKQLGIHVTSAVSILRADNSVYAAQVDDKLVMKIGPADFKPTGGPWKVAHYGHHWCVWTRQ